MSDRARQAWICGGYGPTPDLPIGEHHAAAIAGEPAQVAHSAAGVSLDHLAKAGRSADMAFTHWASLLAIIDAWLAPSIDVTGVLGRKNLRDWPRQAPFSELTHEPPDSAIRQTPRPGKFPLVGQFVDDILGQADKLGSLLTGKIHGFN